MDGFPTGVTLARALAVARWLTWLWMVAIVVVAGSRSVELDVIRPDDPSGPGTALRQPVAAWLAVALVGVVAAWATARLRPTPDRVLSPRFALTELSLALGLSALDGWVFDPGHVFATSQSLATQYPLIAVATVGLVFGSRRGIAAGTLVGPAEWWGAVLNGFDDWGLRHVFSIVATSIFFAAVGGVVGWLSTILRRVESQIADQRARDEVAGVLHDTVLQTLALVEQRTAGHDPELADAARRADRELRSYLFDTTWRDDRESDDLERSLRRVVDAARNRVDPAGATSVTVNVVDLGSTVAQSLLDAMTGACGEAVTNALVHAEASRVVVFAETDDDGELLVSVRDDGHGFDVDAAMRTDRRGLRHSIRERVSAAGGSVRLTSSETGTEVLLSSRSRPEGESDER